MDKNTIAKLTDSFNSIMQQVPDSDIEYWYARDLQELLGYTKWQNFLKVLDKAKESAGNSGVPVENHFTGFSKMVQIGSGAERAIDDVMLTHSTIQFRELRKKLNNSDFNRVEFDSFIHDAGSNAFTLSPQNWISVTNAIGIISKAGRYGGTFAHKYIAFERLERGK